MMRPRRAPGPFKGWLLTLIWTVVAGFGAGVLALFGTDLVWSYVLAPGWDAYAALFTFTTATGTLGYGVHRVGVLILEEFTS